MKELLDRYSKGLCTREECRRIERHILKNPVSGNWQWRDERHRHRTEAKIRAGLLMLRGGKKGRGIGFRRWMYAAAAVVALGLGIWLWPPHGFRVAEDTVMVIAEAKEYVHDEVTVTFPNGKVQVLEGRVSAADLEDAFPHNGESDAPETWLTVRVPSRKYQEITLADGSSVWLNAGTTFRFPRAFAKAHRHVHLEGEGYFDIARDADRPFHVFAGGGEIKVTGTAFNVQAFADRQAVRTSLVEGGVSFYMADQEYKLTSGLELLADVESGTVVRRTFDIAQTTSWKDGYFAFDNLDLLEVMTLVSRWYNVTAMADIKLPDKRIGGSFPMDQPLEDLLQDLSILSGAAFEVNGKEVRIVR